MKTALEKLKEANAEYVQTGNAGLRRETAENGQHPYAIVVCCSDSRVIPERIFSADLGELFVIRVAGNVLDRHALGSIEYATAHLGVNCIVVLGHTGCGAITAALEGHAEGYIADITDEIRRAIGSERDPLLAAKRNVFHGVERIKRAFSDRPAMRGVAVLPALYDIRTGKAEWL